MKIGFSKVEITPPVGLELGGYAGYRPNKGVHDPLFCKTVLVEQEGKLFALIALDLLCADESLCAAIAEALTNIGIKKEHLIVYAIHTHAAPVGVIPGKGVLACINETIVPHNPDFLVYMQSVIKAAVASAREAVNCLENFRVRSARGTMPPVGSERHTGEIPRGELSVVQFLTDDGKSLVFYSFPCHPTVLSAANLEVSADFIGTIEKYLHADMAVFANGAAGDISTRFTRKESSFDECSRMGKIVADHVFSLIEQEHFAAPTPLHGFSMNVTLPARQVETEEAAIRKLEETTECWEQAKRTGVDATMVRILKSYVEGAGVNLEFSRSMGSIQEFTISLTAFSFACLNFITIPGEFYSTLLPNGVTAICYANGYYRYIADENAYDKGHYETLAAIVGRGSGEIISDTIRQMLDKL